MSSTPCFKHENCNGTSVETRLRSFYSGCGSSNQKNSNYGENIAKGKPDPISAINIWICESFPFTNDKCLFDGLNDGHRSNLLRRNYHSIGIGVVEGKGADIKYVYTNYLSTPIHSGSHYYSDNKLSITYGATFYDDYSKFKSINGKLFINSDTTGIGLDLKFGTSTKGVYLYVTSSFKLGDKYYFEFTAESSKFRYPEEGVLVTVNDFSTSWLKN